jgi:hypothetical protein
MMKTYKKPNPEMEGGGLNLISTATLGTLGLGTYSGFR